MRAVNLIPPEQRRVTAPGGRSNGAVLVLLGGLGVAFALVLIRTLTGAAIDDRRAELEQVRADTATAQRAVNDLQAYTTFASLREKRVETVRNLAASRFDWAAALREVARTVPDGAWLSGLRGTVSPSVSVEATATDPLRTALTTPAIEVQGCTTGQTGVAYLVAELRRIDGVTRVSLSSSEKPSDTATAGPASATGPAAGTTIDPCARPGRPKFSLTVFFATPTAPAPAAAGGATTTVAAPAGSPAP